MLPLAAILVIAAPKLPYPLHGDQTVFLMGAESMAHGGVLYRDFWDTKQPGVFLFYELAGKLFGFTSLGVHLLELLWMLVLAAWMVGVLRSRFETPGLASFTAIAAVGGYYAVAGTWEMTQVEMLAALPLFICCAAVLPHPERPRPERFSWFESGLAAGAAALFKLLFGAIPVAIWIAASVAARREERASWRKLLVERWLPAAGGVLVVLGATAVWFALAGALRPMLWTNFVYPGQALASGGWSDPGRLLHTVSWFAVPFGLLAGFALVWLFTRRDAGRERAFDAAAVWLAAAVLIVLVQTLSWWRYHALLWLVPLAILGMRGVDTLARLARERLHMPAPRATALALALAAVACAPAWRMWLPDAHALAHLPATHEQLVAYQRHVSPAWDAVWTDTAFLRAPGAQPGPIYVFGDPRAIHLAGRRQAIPVNGWSWESYAERQWEALPGELVRAAPAYVGFDPGYEALVRERSPATWAWLEANYRVSKSSDTRTWYERRRG